MGSGRRRDQARLRALRGGSLCTWPNGQRESAALSSSMRTWKNYVPPSHRQGNCSVSACHQKPNRGTHIPISRNRSRISRISCTGAASSYDERFLRGPGHRLRPSRRCATTQRSHPVHLLDPQRSAQVQGTGAPLRSRRNGEMLPKCRRSMRTHEYRLKNRRTHRSAPFRIQRGALAIC